jgi:hypothetical protein
VSWGWRGTFAALASVAFLSSLAAGVYLHSQKKREPAILPNV